MDAHVTLTWSDAPIMRKLTIAIDGPSGAGKGTVARAVALELGYRHVDSGAMYRAIAWKALKRGVPLEDEEAVARVAEQSTISLTSTEVAIDGDDVTRAIRTPEIDRAAAAVARLPRGRGRSPLSAGNGVTRPSPKGFLPRTRRPSRSASNCTVCGSANPLIPSTRR